MQNVAHSRPICKPPKSPGSGLMGVVGLFRLIAAMFTNFNFFMVKLNLLIDLTVINYYQFYLGGYLVQTLLLFMRGFPWLAA